MFFLGIIIAWLHIIFYVIAIGSLIVKLILDFDSDDTIPNNIAELEEITPTTNIEKSYILSKQNLCQIYNFL